MGVVPLYFVLIKFRKGIHQKTFTPIKHSPMKHIMTLSILSLLILFTACKKDTGSINPTPGPGSPGNGSQNPPDPSTFHVIKVKATIKIGDVIYDSIPAIVELTSWDSTNGLHQ